MRRRWASRLRAVACLLLTALPQFLPAQDILGTEWRSAAGGRLEFRVLGEPAPQDGASIWQPLIPELRAMVASEMSDEAQFLAELGPMAILPLFLHGHGGAVGIAEAERRLTKLGIGHTILATQGPWPDDETHDLLRISLLSRSGVAVSRLAMRHFQKSPSRFVRAAAAVAANDAAERSLRARSDQARLDAITNMPSGHVFALGVDAAALADIDGLLAAWRHYCRRRASEGDLRAGGAVPLDQFAVMQRWMDIPGQLPLEVAAVIGNWRCDYVAFARFGNGAWWLHVAGDFSPDVSRRGLRSLGGEIGEARGDAARAVLRGLRVTVTATALEVEAGDVPVDHRVGHDPELLRLTEGVDAWARVGRGEDLQALGLAGIDLQLRGGVLTGTAAAPVPADLVSAWRRWLANVPSKPTDRLGGLELQELEALSAGSREEERDGLAWCRLLQSVEIDARDGGAVLRLDLRNLSTIDLVRLLARWPGKARRLVEGLPRGR